MTKPLTLVQLNPSEETVQDVWYCLSDHATHALVSVLNERERQRSLKFSDLSADEFDKTNTQTDWVAYIAAYAGRAPDRVHRNVVDRQRFRENMVKVAALALAAIEATDRGYC